MEQNQILKQGEFKENLNNNEYTYSVTETTYMYFHTQTKK